MHYMLVTSITLPLQAASNGRNYMHYMAHYMLSKMLMWQLLAIIGYYWLLLVLLVCEKYYYYWLLLDYTHIINYWDYSKSIIVINLFGYQLLQLFAFIAIIEVKCYYCN